jgi:hypothetical protein
VTSVADKFISPSPSGRALQLSRQSNAASLRLAVAGIFDLVCKPNALSDFVDVDASVLQGRDVKKNVRSARIILDEAESAVCVPHFQCTGAHLLSLLQPELDQAADGFGSGRADVPAGLPSGQSD